MKDFRLSWLFKKKWEKYLMKDRTGRIYFEAESEWLIPILKYMKGKSVDISVCDYWYIRNMIIDFKLFNYVDPRIKNLEHLDLDQTWTIVRIMFRMNWTSVSVNEICSLDKDAVDIDSSTDHFLETLACRENILLIAEYTNGAMCVLASDRAIFTGRKGTSAQHTSVRCFSPNVFEDDHGGLLVTSIRSNGKFFFPLVIQTENDENFHICKPGYYWNHKTFKRISVFSITCSTKREGLVLADISDKNGPSEISFIVQSPSNLSPSFEGPIYEFTSAWTSFVQSEQSFKKEIKQVYNEYHYVVSYSKVIWGSLLENIDIPSPPEVITVADVREVVTRLIAIKDQIEKAFKGDYSANHPIVSFNVEGERLCLLKSTITRFIPDSSLAVRISGRWTEQSEDVDEEGNLDVDFPKEVFKPFFKSLRASCYVDLLKDGYCPWFFIDEKLKAEVNNMLDYYLIPQSSFHWHYT